MLQTTAMLMTEFIRRLCDVLCWRDSAFSIQVRNDYYDHLKGVVGSALATLAGFDQEAGQVARLLLDSLAPEQLLDFISAPHIAALINSPGTFRRPRERSFFLKMLGIRAGCISDDQGLYNHRGEVISEGLPSRGTVSCGESYRISFAGDLPIPFMDRGGNALNPVTAEDAECIRCKLGGAAHLIRTLNENAWLFSLQHTEVLAFRYEGEFPLDFSSGSFQTLPGFSLICNCHLPSVSESELADAIIHEAVHAIIYQFEAFSNPLCKTGSSPGVHVISPWTGTPLPVESFAQACLVWFALAHFWKAPAHGGEKDALRFYERARKGFALSNYANACRSCDDHLSPGVSALLSELQSHVV